jgi:hypothetical protein
MILFPFLKPNLTCSFSIEGDVSNLTENSMDGDVLDAAIKAAQENQKLNAQKTTKKNYLEIPKDKKAIINMLVKPKTFGAGLFDYSC